MSRVISLRDLLLSEELKHIRNEIELIHPCNDSLIRAILTNIGFHPQHDIEYIPSYHRDMAGKAAIGFQACGEMSRERQHNKFLDAYDIVVSSGYTDVSLAKELVNSLGRSNRYERPVGEIKSPPSAKKAARYEEEEDFDEYESVNEDEYVEDEYLENREAIRQLEEIRDFVRSENLNKGN